MRKLKVYEVLEQLSEINPDSFVTVRIGEREGENEVDLIQITTEHSECLVECSDLPEDSEIVAEHAWYERALEKISWEIANMREALEDADTEGVKEILERIECVLNSNGF